MSRDRIKIGIFGSEIDLQQQPAYSIMSCPECGEEVYQKDAADLKISQIDARKIFKSLVKVKKIKDVDKCITQAEEWLKKYGK